MPRPRLITHRPDDLRLTEWGWRDGAPHLAAWLDVSYATGDDWHDPDLVLIDVEALPLMEALYGVRAGMTLVLAADAPEAARAFAVSAVAPHRIAVRTDRRHALVGLVALLEEHARHAGPEPAGDRPRLRLVSGGRAGQAVRGAAR